MTLQKDDTAQALPRMTFTRQLWVHLRDEGGWWTCAELVDALCPDIDKRKARGRVEKALSCLQDKDRIEARPRTDRTAGWCYGITSKCRAMPGLNLEPAQ